MFALYCCTFLFGRSFDYVQDNTGKILYKDPDFREGDFECNLFDDEKRLTKSYSGHSIWQTEYFYDANSKLVSKSVVSKKDGTGKNYVSTYEYSASGKLLRKTDANGIVYENIYNDKGVVIKTMTYNKEEPTSKFYEETIVDDTGKETKAVNALGEKVSTFEYEGGARAEFKLKLIQVATKQPMAMMKVAILLKFQILQMAWQTQTRLNRFVEKQPA